MLRSALHHLKPLSMLERDVKANVNARTSKIQILPLLHIDKKVIQRHTPAELKAKITKPRHLSAYHALPVVRGDMKKALPTTRLSRRYLRDGLACQQMDKMSGRQAIVILSMGT